MNGGDEAIVFLLRMRAAGGDDALFILSEHGALLRLQAAFQNMPGLETGLHLLLACLEPLFKRCLSLLASLGFDGLALIHQLLGLDQHLIL